MTTGVTDFLNNLTAEWETIKQQVTKYFDDESRIREDGAVEIFKRPWIAPQNFGIILFPPVDKSFFVKFKEDTKISIPTFYQDILLKMNGCFVFDFELFGLPKSVYTTGLLDRTTTQQLDLGSANKFWKNSYKLNKNLFYIGARAYSFDENIGYFIDEETIYSIRTNGEVIATWTTFDSFLAAEIKLAEKMMLEEKEEQQKTPPSIKI